MGKSGSFLAGVLVTAVAGCAAAIAYKMFKEKLDEDSCCCRCDEPDDDDFFCGCDDKSHNCGCGCEDCDDGFDEDFITCNCGCEEKDYIECGEKIPPSETACDDPVSNNTAVEEPTDTIEKTEE